MAKDKKVLERLDKIEEINRENNQLLKEIFSFPQETIDYNNTLRLFLIKTEKSYRWFGNKHQFKNSKTLAILANVLVLLLGIASTVMTAICFGFYSTFTLFENIWLIFSIVIMAFLSKNFLTNEIYALASNSPIKYKKDKLGMMLPKNNKIVFILFKWFALVAIALNIVFIWFGLGKNLQLVATILEGLFLVSIILAFVATYRFYSKYSIVWLEGHKVDTQEKVVLVLLPGAKELITEEEFKNKLPSLFE